jgi:hypothetical protein
MGLLAGLRDGGMTTHFHPLFTVTVRLEPSQTVANCTVTIFCAGPMLVNWGKMEGCGISSRRFSVHYGSYPFVRSPFTIAIQFKELWSLLHRKMRGRWEAHSHQNHFSNGGIDIYGRPKLRLVSNRGEGGYPTRSGSGSQGGGRPCLPRTMHGGPAMPSYAHEHHGTQVEWA